MPSAARDLALTDLFQRYGTVGANEKRLLVSTESTYQLERMVRRKRVNRDDVPEAKQMFRAWVDVLELGTGVLRKLPLKEVTQIHFPTKKNQERRPDQQLLLLTDDAETLEAPSIDDLAGQLRQRYPDERFTRTLHVERDHEAEKRWFDAMSDFGRNIADSFVQAMSADDTEEFSAWLKTKEGKDGFPKLWPTIVDGYFNVVCNPKRGTQMSSSPIVWFLHCLRRYAQFGGRASRPEYWWFYLIATIIGIALRFLGHLSVVLRIIGLIWAFGILIPHLAAASRRLHDSGNSAWWLVPIPVGIVFLFIKGYASRSHDVHSLPGFVLACLVLLWVSWLFLLIIFLCSKSQSDDNRYGSPAPQVPT